MEVAIKKETNITVKYFDIYCGGALYDDDLEYQTCGKYDNLDDFLNDYPSISKDDDVWFRVEVDTGRVVNWPKNLGEMDFHDLKVVDGGTYAFIDEKGNTICCKQGYVPSFIGDEYGDYFEFDITKNGYISPWKITESDISSFIDSCND